MKKCEAVVEAWVAHCEVSDEIQRPNLRGLMNCHDERFHIWEITKVQRNVCAARSLQSDDPDVELCQK